MTPARLGLLGLALLVLALAAWVRLAPSDPGRWHRGFAARPQGDYPSAGGFEAHRALDRPAAEVLAEADRLIRATPRSRHLAGSLAEGRITYLTRSRLWGFPDYTTVWIGEGPAPSIAFLGRQRFGTGDMGVNRARIRRWLAALGLDA